jgi:ABC-type nitrate/sulfonate/bicarbonate transport system substrate-binding protein
MARSSVIAAAVAVIAVIAVAAAVTFVATGTQVTTTKVTTQTLPGTTVVQTITQTPTTPTTTQKPLTKVKLQLNWVIDTNQAGFFVAKDKGFYAQNGLDVDLFAGRGAVFAINQVVAGNAELGVTGLNFLLPQKERGANVTAIFLLFANHPASYFTLRSDIKSPSDFAGKRVGVQTGSASDYNIFLTLMKQLNVNISTITQVPITFDMWTPLITNKADASMGWFTNQVSFFQAGVNKSQLKIFRAADYGLNIVSTGVFARDDFIKSKPELVRAFVNASLYGWKYTYEHPGEAVDIVLKANPDLTRSVETELLDLYLKDAIWGEPFKTKGLGWFDDANWARTQQIFLNAGIITKQLPLSTFYTNQFLPATPIFPNSPYAPRA